MKVIAKAALWIVGIFTAAFALLWTGQMFRLHTFYFSVAWLLCPVIGWFMRHSSPRRTAITTVAVALSFIHLAHFDWLRDQLGQTYIHGYEVEYVPDTDDNGRPTRTAEVTIPSDRDRRVVNVVELAFLVLLVGVPYMTWRASLKPSDGPVAPSASGNEN